MRTCAHQRDYKSQNWLTGVEKHPKKSNYKDKSREAAHSKASTSRSSSSPFSTPFLAPAGMFRKSSPCIGDKCLIVKENYFYKKRLACLSWQGCQSRGTAKSCCFVRKYFWHCFICWTCSKRHSLCRCFVSWDCFVQSGSSSPITTRFVWQSKLPFKRYQALWKSIMHTPYLQYCIVTALSRDVCKWLILGVPGKRRLEWNYISNFLQSPECLLQSPVVCVF